MALHGQNISTQLVRLNTEVKSELDEIGKKKETYSYITEFFRGILSEYYKKYESVYTN